MLLLRCPTSLSTQAVKKGVAEHTLLLWSKLLADREVPTEHVIGEMGCSL